MGIIDVQVNPDHLERIASSSTPASAIAELIWNSLDADATQVEVLLIRNELEGVDGVKVIDNGCRISISDASKAFSNLGGSSKRHKARSLSGRIFYGHQGKGRFQAFCLGNQVIWTTRYEENGGIKKYQIKGHRSNLKRFIIDDSSSSQESSGTTVEVTESQRSLYILESPKTIQKLTEQFALYLRQYQDVSIRYNGQIISPENLEEYVAEYSLEDIKISDGRTISSDLTIIEWSISTERALYICDQNGFTIQKINVGIQAPGFVFTAYLKSDFFRELDEVGLLQVEDFAPDLKPFLNMARDQMREHFRPRAALQVVDLVQQWKDEDIYPYEGMPESVLEEAERQIFDVVALNVQEYLPDFQASSAENKKLQFRLLRNAIETSPESVQAIIRDVLKLPAEKQEELAELLERTSLEAMINASKVVADRLDLLQGIELLICEPEWKKRTLERRHLHKIIAEHTWIFGEEFNLSASDRSLTYVLRRHLDLTNKELLDDTPVVREDGSEGIVDLMLSRVIPQPRADQHHHLIVELKRPSVSIGNLEASQVKDYALSIVEDDRFRDTSTRWEFWAVSNKISGSVQLEANQSGRPPGLLLEHDKPSLRIWVKTWGQIIDSCRARLRFFQEKLNYVSDEEAGLEYLRKVHNQYLPLQLRQDRNKS